MSSLYFLDKLLSWQKKNISDKNFLIILSILVGFLAGVMAIALKKIVHFLQYTTFSIPEISHYYYLLPIGGVLLSIILAKLLYREHIGHAISDVLFAIFKKSGLISQNKMYSRFFTSMVTVGLGGSAGLEAPIVLTGSAIGSNVGKTFLQDYKNRVLLIGCGSAAVISAIFNAPITGLIFSMEVILFDIAISSFIPLLMASVTASLTSILFYEDETLFSFRQATQFEFSDLPYYLMLGVFCALIAIGFNQSSERMEKLFKKISHPFMRFLIGVTILVGLIRIFPSLYGEGYQTISNLLSNRNSNLFDNSIFFSSLDSYSWTFLGAVLFMLLAKYAAFSCTIGAGGYGGTFAPSLYLGCISGFVFSKTVNQLSGNQLVLSEATFSLVGMCGVLSATQYAPLTAIFLIAELTGGYTLFIPLMFVSAISFTTVSYFYPDSPYIKHLIDSGEYVKGDTDTKILSQMDYRKLIEKDFFSINQDAYLKDLIEAIKKCRRNLFPIVNNEDELVGFITLDEVREKIFQTELQNTVKIKSIMMELPAKIELGEKMTTILDKFETTKAWNLPVVENKKYVGFISKSRIFNYYREELIEKS